MEVAQNGGRQQAAKHVGQGAARVEPGDAAGELGARVPAGHEEDDAGEEGGLDEAQEEADYDEVSKLARGAVAGRHGAPEDGHAGKVERRPHARDNHVGRQLHEQVADEEDGRRQVEVGARHAEIGLERALPRLRQVGPVQEVEQVHEHEQRQQPPVHLAQQLLLLLCELLGVPRGEVEGRHAGGRGGWGRLFEARARLAHLDRCFLLAGHRCVPRIAGGGGGGGARLVGLGWLVGD